jgi:hypothetical protein
LLSGPSSLRPSSGRKPSLSRMASIRAPGHTTSWPTWSSVESSEALSFPGPSCVGRAATRR